MNENTLNNKFTRLYIIGNEFDLHHGISVAADLVNLSPKECKKLQFRQTITHGIKNSGTRKRM